MANKNANATAALKRLEKETREFDKEFIADTFSPLTAEAKARWERIRGKTTQRTKPHRPTLVSMSDIRKVARQIVRQFKPRQIIFFGSRAAGTAIEKSDVNLLIIMPLEGDTLEKAVEIRLAIRPPFPVDILVKTPKIVRHRIAMGDCFIQGIIAEGKVLYDGRKIKDHS